MPTIPELLIRTLHRSGVKYIFGVPGGPWLPYLDVMQNQGMQYVLVSNEASAGIMAAVSARITGQLGVCQSTFGAGATNLSTGIGCAFLDRSPVLALTAEHSDSFLKRTVQMNIDQQAFFHPITKWTTRVSKDNVAQTIHKAISVAQSEVPGPVNIGIPADFGDVTVDDFDWTQWNSFQPLTFPDEKLLKRASLFLQKAQKPILAVGLTASRFKLHNSLRSFLGQHKMPVLLTPMAKGMLPDSHECYLGVLFHALSEQIAKIYRQADLIISIGYDPVEFNYEQWMPNVPLIHIDTSPADIAEGYDLACDIVGDLRFSLEYLNSLPPFVTKWDFSELTTLRKNVLDLLSASRTAFGPRTALSVLRDVLPESGIMCCDVGAHAHLIGQKWPTPVPGLQIMTNGWSSMGFGVPAAMAAKLHCPDRQVVCVTGDGGFLMMAGEMLTARRLGLNVVFLIFADMELSLMTVRQRQAGFKTYATILSDQNFFDADTFFGIPAHTVRDQDELKSVLIKALNSKGPSIIEAVVDPSEYINLIARNYK